MARIYPSRPAEGTKSRAEIALHAAFASQLPADWTVFHSVRWLLRDASSGSRDGETDFLILNPARGILLVEVKGGNIAIDGATGAWSSNGFAIKNPVQQAVDNKYSLLRKLKEMPHFRDRQLEIFHAIALPDVDVRGGLGSVAPPEIIIDRSAMSSLRATVDGIFAFHLAKRVTEPLSPRSIETLIELFYPSRTLAISMSGAFAEETRRIIELTEQQYMVLDLLSAQRRVAIQGCAGSGKTMLAIEQARRLADQGFKVLLVCFNKNLANRLYHEHRLPESITIQHFHGLCMEYAHEAGLYPERSSDPNLPEFFSTVLPESLLKALEIIEAPFDAVLVDEGQDFQQSWWFPLQCLLKEPEGGLFYVFFDDNQNLYKRELGLPLELPVYPLSINCRNTQQIHRAVLRNYRGERAPTSRGPDGRKPDLYTYESDVAMRKKLGSILHKLAVEERLAIEEIVILTQRQPARTLLWQRPDIGNWELTERWPPESGEVYATTIHQFKGLESPVVILTEIAPSDNQNLSTLLYIGCSRARNHLIVIAPLANKEELESALGVAASQ